MGLSSFYSNYKVQFKLTRRVMFQHLADPLSHKTPEISSTLSAISRRTIPTGSAARTATDSPSTTASNVGDVYSYESLPARYRRRPLTQEEIQYIEVCCSVSAQKSIIKTTWRITVKIKSLAVCYLSGYGWRVQRMLVISGTYMFF